MSALHISRLRTQNRALDYFVSHHSPLDPKLQTFIDSFPKFADDLYCSAEDEARYLLREKRYLLRLCTPNPLKRLARGIAAAVSGRKSKQRLLADCIFDLHLTAFFTVFMEHLGVADGASALVDALLYQASGSEPASPTEDEQAVSDATTENVRGVHKFVVARKTLAHLGDVEGWIFGREFSAIISGDPRDFLPASSVHTSSIYTRARARWHIRYLLFDVLPTDEEKQALQTLLKNVAEKNKDMIDRLGKAPL
jgi:hypothetical protein